MAAFSGDIPGCTLSGHVGKRLLHRGLSSRETNVASVKCEWRAFPWDARVNLGEGGLLKGKKVLEVSALDLPLGVVPMEVAMLQWPLLCLALCISPLSVLTLFKVAR